MASLPENPAQFVVEPGQPLIGIFVEEGEGERVEYFTHEDAAGAARPNSVREALSLIGAWSDLDWDAALEELDRIRHESKPTPPITNL